MTMKTQPISRRALAAGLALAPIAGLPALAGVVSADDPILAALDELRRLKAHIEGLDEAVEKAHDAFAEMSPECASIELDGMVFSEHEAIDSHFNDLGIPNENIDKTIALLESYRKSPLTPEQKAEREAAREAARRRAHEELDALLQQRATAKTKSGYAAADAAADEAFERQGDAERAIFETDPISGAGAIALLRFAADHIEDMGVNDTKVEDVLSDAIRAAADFFEREA
jgi:hypothetical protein